MSTITQVVEEKLEEVVTMILRLRVQKRVSWSPDTIDNEHMNKKKSKCCCIYVPPDKRLDASDSESDISDDEISN